MNPETFSERLSEVIWPLLDKSFFYIVRCGRRLHRKLMDHPNYCSQDQVFYLHGRSCYIEPKIELTDDACEIYLPSVATIGSGRKENEVPARCVGSFNCVFQ
jgi:hypothetical protein